MSHSKLPTTAANEWHVYNEILKIAEWATKNECIHYVHQNNRQSSVSIDRVSAKKLLLTRQ